MEFTDQIVSAFKELIGIIRNPGEIIMWGGLWGLVLIVFLETGALVFFLPGDSLLVTAGLYAAKGDLSMWSLNLLLAPAAILGDATSYYIGAKLGPRVFTSSESRFLKPAHMEKARLFYEKHGGKAIVLARFMPLVRTFVPVVAGAAQMQYRRFAVYNIAGGIGWVLSMTLTGYLLGNVVPNIDQHIEKVIIIVIFLSILPGIIEYFRHRKPAPSET